MIDIIDWRITGKCNNTCVYCYASDQFHELSISERIKIAEILSSHTKSICISGGEPLLLPEDSIISIFEIFKINGVDIHLSTNGTNFFQLKSKMLKYISRISLPLDGYDTYTNRINGRNIQSFETVKSVLDYRMEHRDLFPFVKINTTITNRNCDIDFINNIYNLLLHYDVDKWEIYEFIPEGRGKDNNSILNLQKNEFIDLQKSFFRRYDNRIQVEFASRESRNAVYFIVRPDGTVLIPVESSDGCVDEIIIGDIKEDSFENIESEWKKYVKDFETFMINRRGQVK